jgi:hypothetical protein
MIEISESELRKTVREEYLKIKIREVKKLAPKPSKQRRKNND